MSGLEFVDELPEAAPRSQAATRERVDALRGNPGKWARWPSTMSPGNVQKVLDRVGGEGFETCGRTIDGKFVAFARYAPVDEPPTSNGNGHAATPPPESVSTRPRAKCPTCSQFINIETGEDQRSALTRHEHTNPVCKAANRRHR